MAHCGWCRPSLIWADMLGETESTADWCLSNPLVGWLLASHTAGHRHSVCVGTARRKNHYYCGLTSVVIKKRQSADGRDKPAICGTKGYKWNIMCPCLSTDEMNYKNSRHEISSRGKEKIKSAKEWLFFLVFHKQLWQGLFSLLHRCKRWNNFPSPRLKNAFYLVTCWVHAVTVVVLTLISRDPLCLIKKNKIWNQVWWLIWWGHVSSTSFVASTAFNGRRMTQGGEERKQHGNIIQMKKTT